MMSDAQLPPPLIPKNDEAEAAPTTIPVLPPPKTDDVYTVTADNGDVACLLAASDFPDAAFFEETVLYPAISVPSRQTATYKKKLKHIMVQGSKDVYPEPDDSARRILVFKLGVTKQDLAALVGDNDNDDNDNDKNDGSTTNTTAPVVLQLWQWIDASFPIARHYPDDFSTDELLRKILPVDLIPEIPGSFELVGHLAHVNLRDECLPYKFWIGRVLLDKNAAAVRTVVNKIGTINTSDSVFRTFQMEVLAGDAHEPDWSVTTVHEHGCAFQLDYRHVYWNSRLSGEHDRLVRLIRNDAAAADAATANPAARTTIVVADLMAGVGPFAVPLTSTITAAAALMRMGTTGGRSSSSRRQQRQRKKQSSAAEQPTPSPPLPLPPVSNNNIAVYANDLNPVSYQYLKVNAAKNKCVNLHCSNHDARAFLHMLQQQQTPEAMAIGIHHVIMNLPATAPEFLDAFRGWKLAVLPLVHVHCFAPKPERRRRNNNNSNCEEDPNQVAIDRCVAALGCPIPDATVHVVRDVSPGKNMLCVSFRLPVAAKELPASALVVTTTGTMETTTEDNVSNVLSRESSKRAKLE